MKHKVFLAALLLNLFVGATQAQHLVEARVGNQIWTASNLNVTHFRNGDPIPEARTKEAWMKAAKKNRPAWCYYENNTALGKVYGKMYNWYAVNDPRGLAPEGWHIASEAEWEQLFDQLAGKSIAGLALKSRKGWRMNRNGTDVVGFHGMPGGNRFEDGHFEGVSEYSAWWTTTEFDEEMAYDINLSDRSSGVASYQISKEDGLYVRCVKDSQSSSGAMVASGSKQ